MERGRAGRSTEENESKRLFNDARSLIRPTSTPFSPCEEPASAVPPLPLLVKHTSCVSRGVSMQESSTANERPARMTADSSGTEARHARTGDGNSTRRRIANEMAEAQEVVKESEKGEREDEEEEKEREGKEEEREKEGDEGEEGGE